MNLKLVWSSKLEKCIISEKSITVCPQNSIDEGPDWQGWRICSVAPSLAKRFFFDEP